MKNQKRCRVCAYGCNGSICKSHSDNCESCIMYPNIPGGCKCDDYDYPKGTDCPYFKEEADVLPNGDKP